MKRQRTLIRRTSSEPAATAGYTVEVLGRRFPVTDMVQASAVVDKLRDETGMGAREMGSQFPVRDGGKIIAFVTFNGRVWAGIPKDYGTDRVHLVYDPSEPAHRAAHKVPPDVTSSRILRNPVDRRGWPRCDRHDSHEECAADRANCGWAGCFVCEDLSKTPVRHYRDTKSELCEEHHAKYHQLHRFDDKKGEWVERNPGEFYVVVDEEGNLVRRFSLRSDAMRFAREHNEDRDPHTMEYFVRKEGLRGCHHLRTSDYARQGESVPRCGICERPRR